MIDWLSILYNFLWILGLAVLLAALSLSHWQAEQQQRSLWQRLAEPALRLIIAGSFSLFGLGLMLIVEPWWYKIGWAGLILLSLWEGLAAWRERAGQRGRS